ncbi:MAG: alanine racemase [Leptospiraceae bacterium]|nr:alanine racemase [Leptospiraceae bacterium]MCP5503458.1 alanine racemase [Leptospiraceae bacterium]
MTKKAYSRPIIQRQYMGAANKFGGFSVPDSTVSLAGVAVEDLVKEFGSPLFVFIEDSLRKKVQELNQAFQSRYPSFQAAWSYKTNYLNAICKVFHEEGSWAEVVSAFEYEKARKNGIPGKRIIFNGPYKPYEALKKAALEGAKIHADHLDEISDLIKIAEEGGKTLEVALRINLDTGVYPLWSRFGFNLESGQALEAARKIKSSGGKVKVCGLHSHIGTFMLDAKPYNRAAKKIVDFYKRLRDELGQPMQYIDLGGGFASANKLKGQYLSNASILPSFDSYAEAITSGLYDAFSPDDPPPLFLETGRALVDEAGYLITSVVANKTMPNGKRSFVIDAGVNLLYTTAWYDLKVATAKNYTGTFEDVSLYGPLCMNIDMVRESCLLPNMQRGEKLVLHPVGAYNVTQWMQFIEMRPAIVMISKEGKVRLIRRKETVDDLLAIEEK